MKYLASFVRKSYYFDFCLYELKALAETFGKKLNFDPNYSHNPKIEPLIKIDIDGIETSNIAEKICERALLTNYIVKVFFLFLFFDLFRRRNIRGINKKY